MYPVYHSDYPVEDKEECIFDFQGCFLLCKINMLHTVGLPFSFVYFFLVVKMSLRLSFADWHGDGHDSWCQYCNSFRNGVLKPLGKRKCQHHHPCLETFSTFRSRCWRTLFLCFFFNHLPPRNQQILIMGHLNSKIFIFHFNFSTPNGKNPFKSYMRGNSTHWLGLPGTVHAWKITKADQINCCGKGWKLRRRAAENFNLYKWDADMICVLN